MADVCDALLDLANRLREVPRGQDEPNMLRLSRRQKVDDDDVLLCGVDELEFKLMGAAMELKRLRAELERYEGLAGGGRGTPRGGTPRELIMAAYRETNEGIGG